jgi:hypothetical protein
VRCARRHAYEAAAAEGRDPAQVITAYDAAALLYFLVVPPTWIVGSIWLSRARANAVLIAPDRVRLSAVWAWLGWWVPVVCFWFPKLLVDDSWQITSSVAAVGARGRYRDTGLWWGLWIAYGLLGNAASNPAIQKGLWALTCSGRGSCPGPPGRYLAFWPSPPGARVRDRPRPKPTSPTWTRRTFDGPLATRDGSRPF